MSDNPQAEMLEPTRLTCAGRLAEATVLLQRRLAGMLRSDTATESAVRWRVPEALHVLFGRTARSCGAGRRRPGHRHRTSSRKALLSSHHSCLP